MSPRDGQAMNPSTARKRKSRGKGLRVRTGCQRCKTRHVKCDEGRPSCGACQKSGHRCEYPDPPAGSEDPGSEQAASGAWPARRDEVGAADADVENNDPLDDRPSGITEGNGLTTAASDFQAEGSQHFSSGVFPDESFYNTAAFETSPDSTWSGWANVSAEAASLKWFGLVATDAAQEQDDDLQPFSQSFATSAQLPQFNATLPDAEDFGSHDPPGSLIGQSVKYCSQDEISLTAQEAALLQHFVLKISGWIDVTDRDRSFAIVVSQMALRNRGVMNAILALSARHRSVVGLPLCEGENVHSAKTTALQYYYQTLSYLQQEMRSTAFLTSDELLATVLLISTYEMVDGSGRGWERHLKGVFWIQRSQLIHGESEGLKQRIWWAWLRQDIWVAFREQRKILSYYHLTRQCSDLGFWELVDRAVWLLGQCVNYASMKEQRAGQADVQGRIDKSSSLWSSLEAWATCFAQFDRRLPTAHDENAAFQSIWINPPAAGKLHALE